MWHVYSPQYKGHDDLSLTLFSHPNLRDQMLYLYLENKARDYVDFMETIVSQHQLKTAVQHLLVALLATIIQIVVRFFVDHRIKQHTSLLGSETV